MFQNAFSQDIAILGFVLAVFAIGLQYIPIDFLFRFFKRRKPTEEELNMIRKILGIIAIIALVFILFIIPKTMADLSFMIASLLIPSTDTTLSLWGWRILVGEVITIQILVVYYIIRRIWKISKRISIEKTDTEIVKDNTTQLLEALKIINSQQKINKEIDIGEINRQFRDWLKGDDNDKKETKAGQQSDDSTP
jgi:hypothetical protein